MFSVLAIDTATDACSVAWVSSTVDRCLEKQLPRAHNRHLLAMVEEILEGHSLADVDRLVCGVGPGSFTGLRIAVATVQGLAWAGDRPVAGYCSLLAQAEIATECMPPESPLVLSTIDAQIDQLYGRWLHWVEGSLVPVSEPFIASPETLMIPEGAAELAKSQGITLLGSGCTYRDRFSFADRLGEQRQAARPGAHVMASRGANGSDALEWSRADHLLPRYVQQDVRWKKLSEQGSNV